MTPLGIRGRTHCLESGAQNWELPQLCLEPSGKTEEEGLGLGVFPVASIFIGIPWGPYTAGGFQIPRANFLPELVSSPLGWGGGDSDAPLKLETRWPKTGGSRRGQGLLRKRESWFLELRGQR